MRIGFIGLGKLGLPISEVIAEKGHEVLGCDIGKSSIEEVVDHSEIVFVAVQTPHKPEHEGIYRIESTEDFDYSFLITVLEEINRMAKRDITVSIISTVSPGTFKTKLAPIITNDKVKYFYNPFFIAMGTVKQDFLQPEFVLLGGHSQILREFYSTIHNRPIVEMTVKSAEIVKMAYNTFITMKIVFANNLMELCEEFGGNVDDVSGALKMATDRIVSTRYMDAGMGDGGGCHPRDNIVLSHLAKKYNMSVDLSGFMMQARERQAEWLVNKCMEYGHKVCVLGLEFKAESDIKTGSAAVLCVNLLKEKGAEVVEKDAEVYLIGCKHYRFMNYDFPRGSVVIDPHRYIPNRLGVIVIRLGE